jgi:acetolactate synthase-1/2/3 large subunit
MVRLAETYGIPARRVNMADFAAEVAAVLRTDGPCLCEVVLDPDQTFEPRLSSRQLPDGRIVTVPLEDMAPFLEREELLRNLRVPPEAGV